MGLISAAKKLFSTSPKTYEREIKNIGSDYVAKGELRNLISGRDYSYEKIRQGSGYGHYEKSDHEFLPA